MKNFRKKVAPAFVLLAGASMSLAGVTYAWFNSNKQAGVSNIKVNVAQSGGGIAICDTQGGVYSNNFDASSATNGITVSPVSTDGTVTSGAFGFYTSTLDINDTNKILGASGAASTSFIRFDMYFENVNNESQKIFFDYSNALTGLLGSSYQTQNANKALRIGFIKEGKTDAKSNAAITDGGTAGVIVEPNEKEHLTGTFVDVQNKASDYADYATGVAVAKDAKIKVLQTAAQGDPDDEGYVPAVYNYYHAKNAIGVDANTGWTAVESEFELEGNEPAYSRVAYDGSDNTKIKQDYYGLTGTNFSTAIDITPEKGYSGANLSYYKKVDTITLDKCNSNGHQGSSDEDKAYIAGQTELFTLEKGYTKVACFIWMEGQDIDCLNSVAGAKMDLTFNFWASTVVPAA